MINEILVSCEAKNYFTAMRERFTKARAIRMTAQRFSTTQACIRRSAYYW